MTLAGDVIILLHHVYNWIALIQPFYIIEKTWLLCFYMDIQVVFFGAHTSFFLPILDISLPGNGVIDSLPTTNIENLYE